MSNLLPRSKAPTVWKRCETRERFPEPTGTTSLFTLLRKTRAQSNSECSRTKYWKFVRKWLLIRRAWYNDGCVAKIARREPICVNVDIFSHGRGHTTTTPSNIDGKRKKKFSFWRHNWGRSSHVVDVKFHRFDMGKIRQSNAPKFCNACVRFSALKSKHEFTNLSWPERP